MRIRLTGGLQMIRRKQECRKPYRTVWKGMRFLRIGICCIGVCFLCSAGCRLPEHTRILMEGDIHPPQFLYGSSIDEETIQLSFSEPVETSPESIQLQEREITSIREEGRDLFISCSPSLEPGKVYNLEGEYWDEFRNSLFLVCPVYGFNTNPASLIINEFSTKGSRNNPDRVELYVLESGNTAGLTLYDGTRTACRQTKILPNREVSAGDYIIVHFEKTDSDWEDETDTLDACTAPGSHPDALDLWGDSRVGISGNNGILTLYQTPNRNLLDGLFYTNRTSDSDDSYRGFGSTAFLEQVEELCRDGGWEAEHEAVRPEDGIRSDNSTATRSICRISPAIDTDSQDDWVIVDTSEASFGYENSKEIYDPR